MLDPRLTRLAEVLVGYSTDVQPGENVLIEAFDIEPALVNEVVKQVYKKGGRPFVNLRSQVVTRTLLMGATDEQLEDVGRF